MLGARRGAAKGCCTLHAAKHAIVVPKRTKTSGKSIGSDYCVDLVKRRDYEGFLCTLLLPPQARQAAFAVRAFNVEVSGVRDAVSERTIGLMRFQFWRDAVEAIYSSGVRATPDQPVAAQLGAAAERHGLSKKLLLRMIECRKARLSERPFSSLDEADEYSHEAFSSLNYLVLECLQSQADSGPATSADGHARHAANQLGQAQGLVTLLRATPYAASRRAVVLPQDLMLEHSVPAEAVMRLASSSKSPPKDPPEGLTAVVQATTDSPIIVIN